MPAKRTALTALIAMTLGLFTWSAMQTPEPAPEASAAPKVAPFVSWFNWGWKRGPHVRFTARTLGSIVIKMRCQIDLTYGLGELNSSAPEDGINRCTVATRHSAVVIPGTYGAHVYFRGLIKTPGYVWLQANMDPSCRITRGGKLAVCSNVVDEMFYVKAGRPRA